MSLPAAPAAESLSPHHPAAPDTRLRGRWLKLARCAWLALASLTLAVFVASLPALYTQLQTICHAAACPPWQITPEQARAVQHLGYSLSGFAAGQVVGSAMIQQGRARSPLLSSRGGSAAHSPLAFAVCRCYTLL